MNSISSTPSRTRLTNFNSVASPVRRRSLLQKPQKVNEVANDDEAERNKRRNAAELERRLTSFDSTSSVTVNNVSKEKIGQFKEHFDLCLRLFTQNKINSTNVWNIHIIDNMRSLVHSSQDPRSMLQMASVSLDIGAKVYSLRVDDVYNATLKLANSLAQMNDKNNPDVEDIDEEEPDNIEQSIEKIKKKKRKNFDINNSKRITIFDNPDKANGVIPKYNGLYNTQSSTEDTVNILNLNLSKTPGNQFELLVRSREANFSWSINNSDEITNPKHIQLKLDILSTSCICPQFKGFSTDVWDANQEEYASRMQDTVYHDENGIPIPDLDLENNDPNNDDVVADDYVEDVEAVGEHGNKESIYVTDMRPCDEPSSNLEYSYRRPPLINEEFNFTGVWAGPTHWKLKSLRQASHVTTVEQLPKNKMKKNKREIEQLEIHTVNLQDLMRKAKNSKDNKTNRLTRKNLINASEHCLLPENLDINADNLFTLNLKHYKVPIQRSSKPVENLNVSTYVYDNPNDTEYCNTTLLGEGWDGEGDNIGDDDELPLNGDVNHDDHNSIHEDDLIEAPDMVPQNFISYAKTAKKMDMKRLKTAMWEELSGVESVEDVTRDEQMEVDEDITPTSLNVIYKVLPSKLSEAMAENLSSPLAFVALLHLANEHSLRLESTPKLNDILIKKDY